MVSEKEHVLDNDQHHQHGFNSKTGSVCDLGPAPLHSLFTTEAIAAF